MSLYKSTTITGEDSNLLVLLFYLGIKDCNDFYFQSDKHKEKTKSAQHPDSKTVTR